MRESDIQSDIMCALGEHPLVAWCMTITTGKVKVGNRYMTLGHYITDSQKRLTGMSDIIGQLVDGRFFCIEVKIPKEEPTSEQFRFMDLVSKNNGVSGWCCDVAGAIEIIEGNSIGKALTKEIVK